MEDQSIKSLLKSEKKNFKKTEKKNLTDPKNFIYSSEILEKEDLYYTNDIVLYIYKEDYYIPEVEILKLSFEKLLINELKIEYVEFDSFYFDNLPVLRIDNKFFRKEEFIDLMIKIILGKENSFYKFFLIDLCRKRLYLSTMFFMWIKPIYNYGYRDRYFLLIKPIMKLEKIESIKNLRNFLAEYGIKDIKTAISKAIECFILINKAIYLIDTKEINFVNICIYCYLRQIIENTIDSQLKDELEDNYTLLIDFCNNFEFLLRNKDVNNEKTTKILVYHQKLNSFVKKEETLQEKKRKLMIGGIIFTIFSALYYKYN